MDESAAQHDDDDNNERWPRRRLLDVDDSDLLSGFAIAEVESGESAFELLCSSGRSVASFEAEA